MTNVRQRKHSKRGSTLRFVPAHRAFKGNSRHRWALHSFWRPKSLPSSRFSDSVDLSRTSAGTRVLPSAFSGIRSVRPGLGVGLSVVPVLEEQLVERQRLGGLLTEVATLIYCP